MDVMVSWGWVLFLGGAGGWSKKEEEKGKNAGGAGRDVGIPSCSRGRARTLCTALRPSVPCASGTESKHMRSSFMSAPSFKNQKCHENHKLLSKSAGVHISPHGGFMSLLREKSLNHRQLFEVEQCASSALLEAKYNKAGCSLHKTERDKFYP